MIQLSVIIVNYNVKYFLEQALRAVRKASRNLAVEVFVVDNNSVDDSVKMVEAIFPEVTLIVNKENKGFSRANNQAIRLSKGQYVLLLNPDTVVEEDTFEKGIHFMDNHPEAGALGVKMIDGSGEFLPESKRGFPTPFAAFSKTFGLSRLFPQSKTFNSYHLGYLDKNATHEVDILSGAFMMMRKKALEEVGLLDEAFFMYGEDIDLSYRIQLGGYKNYYLADTTIIHYKGESTKKGSLNYVRVFYNAMILFARKHFEGQRASIFVMMLQAAIYFRAGLTLVTNFFRHSALLLLEAAIIFIGLLFIKDFWATYHFRDPDYYDASFIYFNAPLYTFIWIAGLYLSGSYQRTGQLRRLFRGILISTLTLAAVYGFLDLEYRSSRAIIVLGALWTFIATLFIRLLFHFLKYKNLKLGRDQVINLIIVGTHDESDRVLKLLQQAQIVKNFIGTVAPDENPDHQKYISALHQLQEVVCIYNVNEIIFCSKDISAQEIMHWMTRLGSEVDYKIVPEDSWSIIGSSSKNTRGELYTIEIQFNIADPLKARNKRLLDIVIAMLLLLSFPVQLLLIPSPLQLLKNCWWVLLGKKTWVGYKKTQEPAINLPPVKPGILSPVDGLNLNNLDAPTIKRINLFYAKDYEYEKDLEIIWRAYKNLGKN